MAVWQLVVTDSFHKTQSIATNLVKFQCFGWYSKFHELFVVARTFNPTIRLHDFAVCGLV